MNQKELLKEHSRLLDLDTIQDCLDLIEIFLKYFFEVIIKNQKETKSKAESEAVLIHQMIFTKIAYVKELINGIEYKSDDGIELINIIDPTIVASNVRNLYETVGMFNLVYVNTRTEDEKTILYNLWVLAGLNFRQRFEATSKTSESKKILEQEKKQISDLKLEIEDTDLYKSLDKKNQNKIQTKLSDKDYKIQFIDNKVIFLNWQELVPIMGIRKGIMDTMYTYFSLYSHPSNVSVFQFGNMFNKNDKAYMRLATFNLNNFFFLLSIFVKDYITLFPNILDTFNKLDQLDQITINAYNMIARDDSYSINDVLKTLG